MATGRVGGNRRSRAARPAPRAGASRRAPLRTGIVALGALAMTATAVGPAAAYPRPGTTARVSVAVDGAEGSGSSTSPVISADGRHVAFWSNAANLIPGGGREDGDIMVHDRETGVIERVSVASDGTEANGRPLSPAISGDGRHVAFSGPASNLVAGDTNGSYDIFVHDRATGVTERVSVASDGTEGERYAMLPAISAGGRHVAFFSGSSNLVAGDTNGVEDVFVHDRETGVTERVSVATDGTQGSSDSRAPAISADGRHVAFYSLASTLVEDDTNGAPDIFVHDREAGVTERASVASDGAQGNEASVVPVISADGRHVAFSSFATNLVPGDAPPFGNGVREVFVRDREAGVTEQVSVASDGAHGNGASTTAGISADGRHVAFRSDASNLVPGDTNGTRDAFVRDREAGTTERVSLTADGAETNGLTDRAGISANGRHVALESDATNLVPGDTNGRRDIFVRDRGSATGVGSLEVERAGDEVLVSGWATFSGAAVSSAADPGDDGKQGARDLGAEILGASITYRPELEDLLLRMDLAALVGWVNVCPWGCLGASTGAGAPGVLYRWALTVGDTAYEVRVLQAAATAAPPESPYFALYECAPTCTETTRLSGGIGATGDDVRVSLPLADVDAQEGAELTEVEASTTLGEAHPGAVETLDEVELADTLVPTSQVELGIAPASATQASVPFSSQAQLVEGRFSGALDVSSLRPGETHRLWARACLGPACGGARSVDVDF